ncbi:hypothetical protein DBR40_18405 [Pedobacter sp. KBW01]|uniref:hypothetical protein n=1 Tax=Pedobacter sp. KBW01 TaxID=2153364 RepID=UPI000F59E517|nr:hypothetical protein [Pedobacter sp. KBW01]RQO68957.1 hypothetical protein DBR40_18405 [Pedobacter sp. KBW01]
MEKGGNIKKSDFVGIGFRDGMPESVGASIKGKVWSPARIGDVLQWKGWCQKMGSLITDDSIDANQLLKDSAEKVQLEVFPESIIVLATDWNEELYTKIHKLSMEGPQISGVMLSECIFRSISVAGKKANFVLNVLEKEFDFSITLGGDNGHIVEGLDISKVHVVGLKSDPLPLKKFFEENPPTLFIMDGSTISGSIQTRFNLGDSAIIQIPNDRIKKLSWEEVVFTTESMYKKGIARPYSVQEYIMKNMVDRGAVIAFNDDNSG